MKHLKQPIARRANLEDDCTGHFFDQRFYSGALLTEEALIAAMVYVDLNPVRAKLAKHIDQIRETSICDRLQVNSAEALEGYLRPVVSGLGARHAGSDSSAVTTVESPSGEVTEGIDREEALCQRRLDDDPAAGVEGQRDVDSTDAPGTESREASPEPEPDPERECDLPPRRSGLGMTLADYIELVRAIIMAESTPSPTAPDAVRRWLARTKVLRKRQRAFGTEPVLRSWIADRGLQLREAPLPC